MDKKKRLLITLTELENLTSDNDGGFEDYLINA